LTGNAVLKAVITFFVVAIITMLFGYFFATGSSLSLTNLPILVSLLLLIPLYVWEKNRAKTAELSKEVDGRNRRTVLFWILVLFILALSIRIPSVLLVYGLPLEKTAVIYLTILTILVVEKTDISAFGFKIERIGRSLVYGALFFILLDGIGLAITYVLFYTFTGQSPVQTYEALPFLLTVAFTTFCVAICEEGLFRGYMQTHLEKLYIPRKAILIQAVFFGAWHFVWNLSPFDPFGMAQYVATTFIIGLFFGYFYSKTRNLVPLVFAHGLWDSVPQGIITNTAATNALQTVGFQYQVLTLALPYGIGLIVTFFFIKNLMRKV
jgi:membrane protease YdiL (CAAX protease family)